MHSLLLALLAGKLSDLHEQLLGGGCSGVGELNETKEIREGELSSWLSKVHVSLVDLRLLVSHYVGCCDSHESISCVALSKLVREP